MGAILLKFTPMADHPNRIRELRTTRKWSLQRLGEEVGCSLQWVGEIERGDAELTLTWMRRFAQALGVKPGDLLLPEDASDELTLEERDFALRLRKAEPEDRQKLSAIADVVMPFLGPDSGKKRA